jgi:hypothetical protein
VCRSINSKTSDTSAGSPTPPTARLIVIEQRGRQALEAAKATAEAIYSE